MKATQLNEFSVGNTSTKLQKAANKNVAFRESKPYVIRVNTKSNYYL